ncbi:diacylglycerol kinase family protein [Thermodesulfovibrio sp.]|uniref:diacylglycerol/lipid kinase family protein n=1 Tax=Thermodesulfovibrio sp. TaxID=2067987 RepID=UPI003094ED45
MKYDRVFLIGNPIAGGGALNKIERASEILRQKGVSFERLLTKKQGDAEQFARKIREKYTERTLVIAAGGDGTYNEIVNGLAHSQIPLAILPMGTTSVLAKELKIPKDMEKAVDLALNGNVERVHLGKIKNKEKSRLFILMAGIGFDGQAVYNVNPREKRHLRKIAYILSGIKTLLRYDPDELKIKNSVSKKAYTVVVSKAACYGGSFKIAPNANLRSPNFYVFLSKTDSKIKLAFQIFAVLFGRHLKMKKTDYFSAESLKVTGDAHVQIDGDYFGKTPVEISLIKNALNLVFP